MATDVVRAGNNQHVSKCHRAESRSEAASAARDVHIVEHFVSNNAVGKALARVHAPLRFATGHDVPDRLRDMFPKLLAPIAAQAQHEEILA